MDISTKWPLIAAALVLSILCIFVYPTLRSKRLSKAYKLPPSPLKLPILGNLHQLLGKPRHEALWQLSKQYGPLMQLHIGSKQVLVISSPEMAKQVLKTQGHIFCSRPRSHAAQRLTYNYLDIAFSPYSSHWKEMRKLMVSEFLGPKRAKLSNHVLVTEMESVIDSLSPNTEVNLSNIFSEMLEHILCKVAFGNNYRGEPQMGPSLKAMLSETSELINGGVGDAFPVLGFFIDHFSGWNRRLNDLFKNVDVYINTIIDDHLKDNVEEISEEDKDFVHTLLEMSSKENASGYRPNLADVKALVMNIIHAGIDTNATALTWAMSEIIRNPRVMQKLQNEIRNCTGRIQKVEEMNTTKMTYLKMVVKETLRLHPPAPLLIPHESLSHTQIAGYDVFPGTIVVINAWGIARDSSNWGENAAEFYPERYENVGGDFGADGFEMLPFGGGRRSCPAKKTAPVTVEFVIANLLYWFDWKPASETKCENLNMEDFGTIVLGKKVPLCLVPTKHKWENGT